MSTFTSGDIVLFLTLLVKSPLLFPAFPWLSIVGINSHASCSHFQFPDASVLRAQAARV